MKTDLILVPINDGFPEGRADLSPDSLFRAGLADILEEKGHYVSSVLEIYPAEDKEIGEDELIRNLPSLVPTLKKLADAAEASRRKGGFTLTVGGDHSVAMGSVAGMSRVWEPEDLTLIWIDAHADSNTPFSSPSGNAHGMSITHLLGYGNEHLLSFMGEKGAVRPENIILIGVRDFEPVEQAFLIEKGMTCFRMDDIRMMGLDAVMRSVLSSIRTGHVHVSFDCDSLDPAYFSSVGVPSPGGLSIDDAAYILNRLVSDGRTGSLDIAEYDPSLDDEGRDLRSLLFIIRKAFSSFL